MSLFTSHGNPNLHVLVHVHATVTVNGNGNVHVSVNYVMHIAFWSVSWERREGRGDTCLHSLTYCCSCLTHDRDEPTTTCKTFGTTSQLVRSHSQSHKQRLRFDLQRHARHGFKFSTTRFDLAWSSLVGFLMIDFGFRQFTCKPFLLLRLWIFL